MEESYLANIGAFSAEMTQNSPVRDIETLKSVTLGEFLDASYTDAEDQQLFFEEAALKGIPANRDTNAFEYFKKEIDAQQDILKAMNPGREKREPLDQEVLYTAREQYLKNLTISLPKFSMTTVRENMSKADKKLFDQGAKLMSRKYYRTPEKIEGWAKKTANKELINKRTDDLNRNFTDFSQEADRREAYDLENDPLYRKAFGKHLGEQASEYEKFLHQHLGAKALMDPPEKRREHLAFVAAAIDFYAKDPEHFNLEAVQAEAKTYQSFDMFKNLSDQEVSKLLMSREQGMKSLHVMAAKKYGVPESERAEYIRKMKALSEAMVPAEGESEKYKEMKTAVDAVAALDPQDPGLESKLFKANVQLYNRVFRYEKGKKSVRTFKTSQARFDNSVDVLSVMNDHIPGLRKHVQKIVDRTNEVRKAKPGDKDYVDLAAYGLERAEKNAPKTSAYAKKNAAAEADKLMKKEGLEPGELGIRQADLLTLSSYDGKVKRVVTPSSVLRTPTWRLHHHISERTSLCQKKKEISDRNPTRTRRRFQTMK